MATQGRASTLEYVTEYIVQYSDDGELWKSVTDPLGDIEVPCVVLMLFVKGRNPDVQCGFFGKNLH